MATPAGRVHVIAMRELAGRVPPELARSAVAVVDQIRATSVMVTALGVGARDVAPVASPDEAFAWRERDPQVLLAGERHARRIEGFDYGNSPLELLAEAGRVRGRTLVMATTNGTRALAAVPPETPFVWAFSLLNVSATAHAIAAALATAVGSGTGDAAGVAGDVAIVCAGTEGNLAQDDLLAAGTLCERLGGWGFVPEGDGALVALDVFHRWRGRERECFLATRAGRNVIEHTGSDEDLAFVAGVDRFGHAVVREGARLVRRDLSPATSEASTRASSG